MGTVQIAVFEVYTSSSFVASDRRFGERVARFFKRNQKTVVMRSSEISKQTHNTISYEIWEKK